MIEGCLLEALEEGCLDVGRLAQSLLRRWEDGGQAGPLLLELAGGGSMGDTHLSVEDTWL